MRFGQDHLDELGRLVGQAWLVGVGRDWTVPAGTLEWSCGRTADHAVDTVFAPALFLASRKQDDYPSYAVTTPGADASPALLVEALETAVRVLSAVVIAADPDARAVIWRRPTPEIRPPHDFLPRGGLELILHGHDVCAGLGVDFDPPREVCEALRSHTRDWPMWQAPGWQPLRMTGDAWTDLLRASGRLAP